MSIDVAVSTFGASAAAKLRNVAAVGQPEDQIRGPFERLLDDLAALCGFGKGAVVAVGESSVADLRTRPDYAVTVHGALVGFIELKAPGKGADPRRFREGHDKAQWQRLQSLPNLLYTDGNEFSLWQNGELVTAVVRLQGDIESSGAQLAPGPGLQPLFDFFLQWQPHPAALGQGTGRGQCPDLPSAARRGDRGAATQDRGADHAGPRLARPAVPPGQ